jgi:hypothetical protein
MGDSACTICESPLRTEIEKKDTAWKADKTIQWARKHGLRISRFSLARHRTNHTSYLKNNKKCKPPGEIVESPARTKEVGGDTSVSPNRVSDLEFLDSVRDRVYEKLKQGEFDLKIESAFKAIEIKHKISDESQNEKLLLEILAEIRTDELKRSGQRRRAAI